MCYWLFFGYQIENVVDDVVFDVIIQEVVEVVYDCFIVKQGLEINVCCIYIIVIGQFVDNIGDGVCFVFVIKCF